MDRHSSLIDHSAGAPSLTPNARLICDLLHAALVREEAEIREIGTQERIERYLCSVAFAPELAVGYLLRKEALRERIPVSCEQRSGKCTFDLMFFEDGTPAALCELKTWHVATPGKKPLRDDVL